MISPQREAELISELEKAWRELCKASETFLSVAEGCRNLVVGDVDNPQSLKIAKALQDMAIEAYQKAVKAFTHAIISDIE